MDPKKFKEWRLNKGWSTLTMAHVLGVSQGTVSNWERGVYDIPNMASMSIDYIEMKTREFEEQKRMTRMPRGRGRPKKET